MFTEYLQTVCNFFKFATYPVLSFVFVENQLSRLHDKGRAAEGSTATL